MNLKRSVGKDWKSLKEKMRLFPLFSCIAAEFVHYLQGTFDYREILQLTEF